VLSVVQAQWMRWGREGKVSVWLPKINSQQHIMAVQTQA
jgi:hypothetical protein